jgi:hypothetical protein
MDSPPPMPPPPDPDRPGTGPEGRGYYPLDFNAIVMNGFSLYRFAWRTLLGAALIPYAIAYAALAPISAAVSPQFNDWVARYRYAVENNLELPALPSGQTVGVLLLVGAALGTALAGVIAAGTAVHIGDAAFRGRPSSVRSALGIALRRAPALIGQQLLLLLAIFGIVLLGFVFGSLFTFGGPIADFLGILALVASVAASIFVAVRWTLGSQVVVLEELGAVEALSRSWRLVAGSGWRVLGYVVLFALIGLGATLLLTGIPQATLGFDPTKPFDVAIGTLIDGFAAVVLAPIVPLLGMLLYFDLRARAGEPAPQPGEARQTG